MNWYKRESFVFVRKSSAHTIVVNVPINIFFISL